MGQHYRETDILFNFFFLLEPSLFLERPQMLGGFPGRRRSNKRRARCPRVQNDMVRVLYCRCNSSVLGQVLHRVGTARLSPWMTGLHLVVLPHVIIKNTL